MSNALTSANRHAENLASWVEVATTNLIAQAQAKSLDGDDLVAAVRAALLAGLKG